MEYPHVAQRIDEQYAIILVTYNRVEHLKITIDAIRKQTLIPSLLIIVNNNSADGTLSYLSKVSTDFPIQIINSPSNVGHGAALALGMERLLSLPNIDRLSLLEDDSVPEPELMEIMFRFLKKSEYQILCLDGYRIGVGRRYRPTLSATSPTEVDFALLDGVVMNRIVIEKAGVPKKDFFMMCDDLEYSKRIRKFHFRIGCVKTDLHTILHLGGGSRFSKSTLWRGYYQARNNVHILKEYFSLRELLDFLIMESKRMIGSLMAPDRFHRLYLRILGVWHGITGQKGKTLDPSKF